MITIRAPIYIEIEMSKPQIFYFKRMIIFKIPKPNAFIAKQSKRSERSGAPLLHCA